LKNGSATENCYGAACGVLEQALLLLRTQHTEQVARLRVVVVIVLTEVEVVRRSIDRRSNAKEIGTYTNI
jgi:hypothetical protein